MYEQIIGACESSSSIDRIGSDVGIPKPTPMQCFDQVSYLELLTLLEHVQNIEQLEVAP